MKSDLFSEICDFYKEKDAKLHCCKFIKYATGSMLKRAKCDILDPFFDSKDHYIDPYSLLNAEEKAHLALYKRPRGQYQIQKDE